VPRPNFFFAFPLEGSFVAALPKPPPAIRRFGADDVHLTLTFLGACGQAAADRALAVLDEILRNEPRRPIDISLGAVVPMGPRHAYSALSALLDHGREETEALIGVLRDPLSEAAIGRRERRAPKAHVTIARPQRRATDAEREAGRAWADALELGAVRQTLDRIALYTWSDDRPRSLFKIVAARHLDAGQGVPPLPVGHSRRE